MPSTAPRPAVSHSTEFLSTTTSSSAIALVSQVVHQRVYNDGDVETEDSAGSRFALAILFLDVPGKCRVRSFVVRHFGIAVLPDSGVFG